MAKKKTVSKKTSTSTTKTTKTTKTTTSTPKKTKVAPKKKKTTPQKAASVTSPKQSTNSSNNNKPSIKSKKLTQKELLMKQFEHRPEKKIKVGNTGKINFPDPPPFFSGYNKTETKRLKVLLLKKFDLKSVSKTSQNQTVKKQPVSINALLKKQFDRPDQKPIKVKSQIPKLQDPPPFIPESDPSNAKRLKLLLLKKIDLSNVEIKSNSDRINNSEKLNNSEKSVTTPNQTPKIEVPKKVIPISELILKKFDRSGDSKIISVPEKNIFSSLPDMPPFISADDKQEVARIRKLLFKTFDLSTPEKSIPQHSESAKTDPETKVITKPSEVILPKNEMEKVNETKLVVSKTETEKNKDKDKDEEPIMATETIQTNQPYISSNFEEEKVMTKPMKLAILGVMFLFAVLLIASFSNSGKYTIVQTNEGVQIWRGEFSPLGKKLIATYTDLVLEEPIKSSYLEEEIHQILCNHYLYQFNLKLEKEGIPDFNEIKELLIKSKSYADSEQLDIIETRMNGIDFLVLLYKADVAMSIGKIEIAKSLYTKAESLASRDYEKEMIAKRLEEIAEIEPKPEEKSEDTEVESEEVTPEDEEAVAEEQDENTKQEEEVNSVDEQDDQSTETVTENESQPESNEQETEAETESH